MNEITLSSGSKTALVFGGTGLVGKELVKLLKKNPNYQKIKLFVRKKVKSNHPKIEICVIDFEKLKDFQSMIKGDDLFITLGTTMAKAKSKAAFIKVDYTYIMKIAIIASRNKVNQCVLVSAAGSDPNSYIFYNRVKGELEKDLRKIEFWSTHVLRPSILLGDRKENRPLERATGRILKGIDSIFGAKFGKFQAVSAENVAKAMILVANNLKQGKFAYSSNRINKMVKEHEQ